MTQTRDERQPDATAAFGERSRRQANEVDHRPGVADAYASPTAGEGERPPEASEEIDVTPLRERFARPKA
jgi:hypothetical protein